MKVVVDIRVDDSTGYYAQHYYVTGWTILELIMKVVVDIRIGDRAGYNTQHCYRLGYPGTEHKFGCSRTGR